MTINPVFMKDGNFVFYRNLIKKTAVKNIFIRDIKKKNTSLCQIFQIVKMISLTMLSRNNVTAFSLGSHIYLRRCIAILSIYYLDFYFQR